MKVNRNDPCPCGSGKKYKHCCLKKGGKIINFPGTPQDTEWRNNPSDSEDTAKSPALEDFEQLLHAYQESLENSTVGSTPPTFMESLGSPNKATAMLNDLHELLDDQEFSSVEEMNSFLSSYKDQQNHQPVDDFLGLSPDQIYRILHGSLADIKDVVTINEKIENKDIQDTPIIEQISFMLDAYVENGGTLLLTEKGNYKSQLVQQFNDSLFPDDQLIGRRNREDDSFALQSIHQYLHDFSLIEERVRKSRITKKGMDIVLSGDYCDLYKKIFLFTLEKLDWVSLIRREEFQFDFFEFIQDSNVFSLFLLKKLASKLIHIEKFYDVFVTAFPNYDPSWARSEPELLTHLTYRQLFINEFAEPMGFVVTNDFDLEKCLLPGDIFKTTPLFKKFFMWHV